MINVRYCCSRIESNVSSLPLIHLAPRSRRFHDAACERALVVMGHSRNDAQDVHGAAFGGCKWSLVCNGMYNQEEDCHALILFWSVVILSESLSELDGVFAFVAPPCQGHCGGQVRSAWCPCMWCSRGSCVSSMERCLNHCEEVSLFPPGYVCAGRTWIRSGGCTGRGTRSSQPTPLELRQGSPRRWMLVRRAHDVGRVPVRRLGLFDRGGVGGGHGTIRTY